MSMLALANEIISNQMVRSNKLILQRVLDTSDQIDLGELSFWRASILLRSLHSKMRSDLAYMKSKWESDL